MPKVSALKKLFPGLWKLHTENYISTEVRICSGGQTTVFYTDKSGQIVALAIGGQRGALSVVLVEEAFALLTVVAIALRCHAYMDYFLIIFLTPIAEFLSAVGWSFGLPAFALLLFLILLLGLLLFVSIRKRTRRVGLAAGAIALSFALVFVNFWWSKQSLMHAVAELDNLEISQPIVQAGMAEISTMTQILAAICLAQLACLISLITQRKGR